MLSTHVSKEVIKDSNTVGADRLDNNNADNDDDEWGDFECS